MPFDWNNFLTLAEELAQDASEVSQRTAISRAYYAIFNVAFARARTQCGDPGQVSLHNWCWTAYAETPDPLCQELGAEGERLKKLRVKADYKEAEIPRLQEVVAITLEDVRKLQANLAAIRPGYPIRPRVPRFR